MQFTEFSAESPETTKSVNTQIHTYSYVHRSHDNYTHLPGNNLSYLEWNQCWLSAVRSDPAGSHTHSTPSMEDYLSSPKKPTKGMQEDMPVKSALLQTQVHGLKQWTAKMLLRAGPMSPPAQSQVRLLYILSQSNLSFSFGSGLIKSGTISKSFCKPTF